MSLFTTTVNAVTTYRIRLKNNQSLGTNWRYNWYAVSSLYPGVNDFYSIEGVAKEDESNYWSLNPYANFVFTRQTEVTETFNIWATVKIFNGNVETCEQILVGSVTVNPPDVSVPVCDTDYTILDVNTGLPVTCIKAGQDYLYCNSCELATPVDNIIFNAKNARVFTLDGLTEYPAGNITLSPGTIPNSDTNAACVRVRWNIPDPDGFGFKLTSYGTKSGKHSNVLVKNYKVPYSVGVAIQGSSSISYGSGTFTYPVYITGLNRFDQTYKFQYKVWYKLDGDVSWTPLYTSSISNLSDVNTTGTINGQFTYTPGPHTLSSPASVQFKEAVYIYKYDGVGVTYDTSSCGFTAEDTKTVTLTYCIDTIPKGTPTFVKDTCPTTITRNDNITLVKTCTESTLSLTNCKTTCTESTLSLTNCKTDCTESGLSLTNCKTTCTESGLSMIICRTVGGPTI